MRIRPVPPDPADPPLAVEAPWWISVRVGAILAVLFTVVSVLSGGRGAGVLAGFLVVGLLGTLGGRAVAWDEARRWRRHTARPPDAPT